MFDAEAYIPYVKATVARFVGYKSHEHFEDLVQEGLLSLLLAYKTYDEHSEVSFITYSRRALYGALTNYARNTKIVVKKIKGRPVNGEARTLSLNTMFSIGEHEDGDPMEYCLPELLVDDEQDQRRIDIICRASRVLTEQQMNTFSALFIEGKTKVEVAQELGVSRQAVQLREKLIIQKLRGG